MIGLKDAVYGTEFAHLFYMRISERLPVGWLPRGVAMLLVGGAMTVVTQQASAIPSSAKVLTKGNAWKSGSLPATPPSEPVLDYDEDNAIVVGPGDADYSGTSPKNPDTQDIEDIVNFSPLEIFYKGEVDGLKEEYSFASYYTTSFYRTSTDPQDALIRWDGGASLYITGMPLYLLAKGAAASDPSWYVWNISDWNGKDDLVIEGLWPDQGAISHVSIFGGHAVPEGGSTLALLGLGLCATEGLRRRLRSR